MAQGMNQGMNQGMSQGMNDEQLQPFLKYAATKRTAGIVLTLTCTLIASLGFFDKTAGLGMKLGLAIPFGALALLFAYVALMPASKHAVIMVLSQRPHDVVWVYPHALEVNGRPSQKFVAFGLADGTEKTLAIGAKTDPTPLLEHCKQVLPQATVGYSPELKAAFKSDPQSLRRQ